MKGQQHEREFSFCIKDFNNVRKLLYKKTGIKLADSKDAMVYSRLARRLRPLNITSVASYLEYIHSNKSEEQLFINALTTNLTSFFREPHHFSALKQFLSTHSGRKRVWCAASSTGEEPYSIAMTVAEVFNSFQTPVEIIASDIDSGVLDTASLGIYSEQRVKNLSSSQLKRFFHRGKGNQQGFVRVVSELRDMVTFKQINLMNNCWDLVAPIDVIFCRNVMIYFDKPTQVDILGKMVKLMADDGLYIAGHSETFTHAGHLVCPLGQTMYRPLKEMNSVV
ncbi:CheR family methyltransferase [Shewanella sp. TC10]|uniref:CheR family methyltransferase n=1 Tax=Shewanella sp. TC10 TaxID=1419739 RepID=UPI00129EB3FB|nr:CheR family methyltransferase [Shewanella sp. TC10]